MKPTLLDTDILSEFFRGNTKVHENVNTYLKEYPFLNFSIITFYEILNGLLYKDAKKQLTKFNEFVELNRVVPLTMNATKKAAEIYSDLRKKGKIIGHTDSLIAGIALTEGFEISTNNTDHFKRVKGLKLTNWLK
jgi:predicted nucleic acid-binding protein